MSYTPTNWKNGDIIIAEKLNNIESGITQQNCTILYLYYDDELGTVTKMYLDPEYTELFAELDINGDLYSTYEEAKAAYDKWVSVLNNVKLCTVNNSEGNYNEFVATIADNWNNLVEGSTIQLNIEDSDESYYQLINFVDNSN